MCLLLCCLLCVQCVFWDITLQMCRSRDDCGNVRQSRPSDCHCHQIRNIHHFIHSHFGIEKRKKKEAESLLTPHHRMQLVRRVWALPGWPARAPDPRRPAGFCSPEPACGQLPTSAADSPPSARWRCSAGPAASYWSDRLNLCSAASWCLRSGAGKITWHGRVQISHNTP